MIKGLKAREILDSRGNPTVEVLLQTSEGTFVSSVPSGASTGSYEAKELRDNDKRFNGKGVLQAVENVNTKIRPLLIGKEVDAEKLDNLILEADGTQDKSNLGANAILGVSMCLFRAEAKKEGVAFWNYLASKFQFVSRIPQPCFNVINGGVHSGGGVSFQEFMVVPQKASFAENLRFATETYYRLKHKLKEKYGEMAVNTGDEGGFVPPVNSSEEILEILSEEDVPLIIDAAATEFFKKENYLLDGKSKSTKEMIELYRVLGDKYPLLGIEDPLEEEDFEGWSELTGSFDNIMIIGDDLLTTNTRRMEIAEEQKSCNAIILKINQIGSISEAIGAARKAKEYGWKIIVSHRSGETNDDFIADFSVGIGAEYIKSGAPARGERVAKYNRLLKIEEEVKNKKN